MCFESDVFSPERYGAAWILATEVVPGPVRVLGLGDVVSVRVLVVFDEPLYRSYPTLGEQWDIYNNLWTAVQVRWDSSRGLSLTVLEERVQARFVDYEACIAIPGVTANEYGTVPLIPVHLGEADFHHLLTHELKGYISEGEVWEEDSPQLALAGSDQ